MQTLVTMVVRVITLLRRLSAHVQLDTTEIPVKTVRTFESILLYNKLFIILGPSSKKRLTLFKIKYDLVIF